MRKLTRAVTAVLATHFVAPWCPAGQKAPVAAAALESHEGLSISAKPWLDPAQYKESFPKRSPYAAGVLAVQVSFRNDSGEAMKVALDRIRLSMHTDADSRQELEPLSADQVADAALRPHPRDPTSHRRFPIPVGSGVKSAKTKDWMEVQLQAQNAAIPTSVIAPHGTVQGLLYFDLQGQFDLLTSAHLYIPDIAIMGKSQSLTYFEIDLSRPAS